ncbi:MAG: acyl-CoA dehydrogenase family protein [Chloroflexi bacterium]|nr:acyl-CoA dehydrogenase family protein [Chloroflexota bacterium]
MEFELTKEQKSIQKAAMEFAEGEFDRDYALEHEQNHSYPLELRKKACELGFVCLHWPEEYGGQGYGVLESVLVWESFCRKDSGLGVAILLSRLGAEIILKAGSEEQKKKYLPPVASGEMISAAAFSEPDHGSDITEVATTAVKNDDEWLINGSKIFITNGCIADYVVVLCLTDSSATPKYRGMGTFVVESGREGFDACEVGTKMGIKMTSTALISFNNVRVPHGNLVGQEGGGFYNTMGFINESRVGIAAQALGTAQGAFDRALAYAKQRVQFGRPISAFQVIQHKLADMATKIETARLMVYKAAWLIDQGKGDIKISSMAKLHAARVAVEVCEEAVQIFGGYGYFLENEVERFYRDARITEIYEGTREIQKNTIASRLIGE